MRVASYKGFQIHTSDMADRFYHVRDVNVRGWYRTLCDDCTSIAEATAWIDDYLAELHAANRGPFADAR